MESFYIDPDAKPPIPLTKMFDSNGNPYYIGKLQFPGTLEFDCGASFFIFVAEDGCEELQIAPLDPARRSKSTRDGASMSGGRFSIDLHPMKDRNGNIYYVGEAIGLAELKLRKGIFFTIFLSKKGQEEIQISRLQYRPKRRLDSQENSDHDESPRSYKRGWPPREDTDTIS